MGMPKGVAVTHRAAAAFVDAEARWFWQMIRSRWMGGCLLLLMVKVSRLLRGMLAS
ncbi:hypothetical protein [Corynebacterium argentoratense]